MNYKARQRRAMRRLGDAAQTLLVTYPPDVRYLSGFTGSNGALLLRGARAVLFTDGRYTAQAAAETSGMRVEIATKPAAIAACEWIEGKGIATCGFDGGQTTVAALDRMRKALTHAKARRSFFVEVGNLVARLREVKDADEVNVLRRAAALGCALFGDALGWMEPGMTESAVAARLEFTARTRGAEGMSFDTIVASGARSALPHGRAAAAKLPKRGFCTLDFGVVVEGYASDMTRTVHFGAARKGEREAFEAVLEAQEAAVAAVRAGVTAGDVDEAARAVLRRMDLHEAFTHSTGHGVGLEIHEGPRLATKQTQVLEAGMVVTIEPGIYLPDRFGIRIEDMVQVTAGGGEVLTAASPKVWIEL